MTLNSDIEGTLFKWTNYWGGWQPRWVVLQNGIFSYYNSLDEVQKGCRSSIKITASDIVAYPNDNTRFDVVVANEQRWYLRAANPAERQAWLIALGTSKANKGDGDLFNEKASIETTERLKKSMSEVRLFCDLLVQQAVNVKVEAQKDSPDVQKLSDSSSVLSTTCDTFLATLGRCLDLSEASLGVLPRNRLMARSQSHDGQHALPMHTVPKSRHKKRHSRSVGQSPPTTPQSAQLNPLQPIESDSRNSGHDVGQPSSSNSDVSSLSGLSAADAGGGSKTVEIQKSKSLPHSVSTEKSAALRDAQATGDVLKRSSKNLTPTIIEDETMLTFFSAMLHSFSDIILEEDGGISTLSFLAACEGIIPFLDTIGSTAFAPVKMDFMGNISKLRTKQSSDPPRFSTIQGILHQEIGTSTTKVRNSATDALMWLKRGLRFMQKFLIIFKNGERNLTLALNQAYSVTLKPYHGWVVKGIFALAVKAAPYPNDFIKALATNSDHAQDKRFLGILIEDIDQYTTAMDVVLNIIDNFYDAFKLESLTVV